LVWLLVLLKDELNQQAMRLVIRPDTCGKPAGIGSWRIASSITGLDYACLRWSAGC
jgi:hypothetical protein